MTELIPLGAVLWQNVRYGMTADEVRGVRSDAVPSSKDEALGDGTIAELAIPHISLVGHDFGVLFYFKLARLTQVTIRTNGGPEMGHFSDLINALRLRYGQEVSLQVADDSFSTAEWLSSEGVNVNIIFYAAIGVLNINFQYRYADAARQL